MSINQKHVSHGDVGYIDETKKYWKFCEYDMALYFQTEQSYSTFWTGAFNMSEKYTQMMLSEDIFLSFFFFFGPYLQCGFQDSK